MRARFAFCRCFFTLLTGLSPDDNWMLHYRPDMPSDPDQIRSPPRIPAAAVHGT